MGLRCKKDDIAIVHYSKAGHEGKVVTCLEFVGPNAFSVCGFQMYGDDYWLTDIEVVTSIGSDRSRYFRDAWLTPLRGDLTDESESTDQPIAEVA